MSRFKNSLLEAFGPAGKRFADALRRLLPKVAFGTPEEQDAARAELQREADRATLELTAAGRKFLQEDLVRSVKFGQRRAAVDLGIKFGGVNIRLVEKLALELAPRLAEAAQSTRPYLARALQEATAFAARLDSQLGPVPPQSKILPDFNTAVTKSLLGSAVRRETSKQAEKSLLQNLGLERSDNVLLLSGRQINAGVYAETVTRTKRMEASNLARADEYQSRGVEYIITSAHAVDDPDDICAYLQGKVWALGPNPYGIPVLPPQYGFPPWHPNCAHTFARFVPELNGGHRALSAAARSHDDDEANLSEWNGRSKK